MKKTILILSISLLTVVTGNAQNLELKTNPIGLMFGRIPVSVEYVINDDMGLETTFSYSYSKGDFFDGTTSASGLVVAGLYKFYFNPKDGGDGFYAFPYLRYADRKFSFSNSNTNGREVTATYRSFGAGFGAGYKWVSDSGLLFDIGAGIGKNFTDEFTYDDPDYNVTVEGLSVNGVLRISIGYRF